MQVAVWYEVARPSIPGTKQSVVPGSRRDLHEGPGRTVGSREPQRVIVAEQVPADRHLDGSLGVAKQVVGRSESRRDVLPVRNVVDLWKRDRRNVFALGAYLGREVSRQRVESHSEVQRQPLQGPLI